MKENFIIFSQNYSIIILYKYILKKFIKTIEGQFTVNSFKILKDYFFYLYIQFKYDHNYLMTQKELDKLPLGTAYLVRHACEPEITTALTNIMLCQPKSVANDIGNADLDILAQFMDLPLNRNGSVNQKGSRVVIESILTAYPAFRHPNSAIVCLSLSAYYKEHPMKKELKPAPPSPGWANKILQDKDVGLTNQDFQTTKDTYRMKKDLERAKKIFKDGVPDLDEIPIPDLPPPESMTRTKPLSPPPNDKPIWDETLEED